MVTLFYLIGVFFFVHELMVLRNPKGHLDLIRVAENKSVKEGEEAGKKVIENYSELTDDQKKMVKLVIVGISYFLWTIIGCLFSSQWILFVSFMAFGFGVGFFRRRFYKNSTRGSINAIKFDAFGSIIFLSLIILNHFHHIF